MSTVVRYLHPLVACAHHTGRLFFHPHPHPRIWGSTRLITPLFLLSSPKRPKLPQRPPIPVMYRPQLPILPVWPLTYFTTRRRPPPRPFPLPLIVNPKGNRRVRIHPPMFLLRKHFCCVKIKIILYFKYVVLFYSLLPFNFPPHFLAFMGAQVDLNTSIDRKLFLFGITTYHRSPCSGSFLFSTLYC